MRLGIFAKTFPGVGPEPVLRAVAEAGFETAQYNFACSGLPSMPDSVAPEAAAEVARASASSGVSATAEISPKRACCAIRVWMPPGCTHSTRTPLARSSSRSASEKPRTAALLAL